MVNLWGPGAYGSARPSATRPALVPLNGALDAEDFFKDCTSPEARDGTEWRSGLINALIANMRSFARKSGVPISNLDDELLLRAARKGFNYTVAGGTANALTVTLDPVPVTGEVADGFRLLIKITTANTASPVSLAVNTLAAKAIVYNDGTLPQPGDLTGFVELMYSASLDKYVILNFSRSGANNVQRSKFTARRGASTQSIPNAVLTQFTNYGSVTQLFFGGSTFVNGLLTVGPGDAGLWCITAGCRQFITGNSGQVQYIEINNSPVSVDGAPSAGSTFCNGAMAFMGDLAAGDTVRSTIFQDNGATIVYNNIYHFGAVRLGAS